jgi:uncharacterized protein (TIGR02246 family)
MMKDIQLTALSLLMIVALGACAPSGSQQSPELAAAAGRWEAALNAGDLDAVVALYSEDCRLLPPNAEMAEGHDAVAAAFGEMIAAGLKGDLDTIEAVVAGDIGYRVGTYSLLAPDGAVTDHGKYIETWKLVEGEWQISNDVWNSDTPAAPAGATTLTITHEVEDPDRWLAAWRGAGSRHEVFAQNGAPRVRTFQNPDDPNQTGVVIDVVDMAAFQAFMNSPEVATAKAEDGVKDATLRVFAEVK